MLLPSQQQPVSAAMYHTASQGCGPALGLGERLPQQLPVHSLYQKQCILHSARVPSAVGQASGLYLGPQQAVGLGAAGVPAAGCRLVSDWFREADHRMAAGPGAAAVRQRQFQTPRRAAAAQPESREAAQK